jgi:hypothetical protein
VEECHAQDKNVIVSSGDDNECFVRSVSSNAQYKNQPIVCSDEENECFVRKVSPQVAPEDDLTHNRRKKILKRRWKTKKQWCWVSIGAASCAVCNLTSFIFLLRGFRNFVCIHCKIITI